MNTAQLRDKFPLHLDVATAQAIRQWSSRETEANLVTARCPKGVGAVISSTRPPHELVARGEIWQRGTKETVAA